MSDFTSIKKAYDAFNASGSWEHVSKGLIYTCNGGWIDFGHLDPVSPRPTIGASNLWRQIRNEGPAMRCPAFATYKNGDIV